MRAVIEWYSNNRASFARQIPRVFFVIFQFVCSVTKI